MILLQAYLKYPSVIDIDEQEMAGNYGPNAEGEAEHCRA